MVLVHYGLEKDFGRFMVIAASPGRQARGCISVVNGLHLLAGSERGAGLCADVHQTLAGLEAGQGLGAR